VMTTQNQQDTQDSHAFAALPVAGVALLTTFRRNSAGVATPVEIRVRGDRVYFTTWSTTGKVKRLAHTPQVTLARCARLGKPTGPRVAGIARRLEKAEVDLVSSTLFRKGLWGTLWNQIYRLRGWQTAVYEVSPAEASTD
jgi:PPOX class probable F420-dependent enzyme